MRRILYPLIAIVVFVVLMGVGYALSFPWMAGWGSTPAEFASPLPGDQFLPKGAYRGVWAITIDAPPEKVWPWLVQMGADRGAFYSNDWAENLTGAGYHNADRIVPAWQNLRLGDQVRSVRPGYLGGAVAEPAPWTVKAMSPQQYLMYGDWGWILRPDGQGRTRLLELRRVYEPSGDLGAVLDRYVGLPMHFVMGRRNLVGIKERAEGMPFVPAPLRGAADVGFALTVIIVIIAAVRLRLASLWLVPGLAWAVTVLVFSHDPRSSAAALLIWCLPAVAAMLAPRGFRAASGLAVVAAMLLVLMLATDAWTAFGLIGLVGALGTVAVLVAIRPRGAQLAASALAE